MILCVRFPIKLVLLFFTYVRGVVEGYLKTSKAIQNKYSSHSKSEMNEILDLILFMYHHKINAIFFTFKLSMHA